MSVTLALSMYQSWKDSWENGTSLEDSVDLAGEIKFLIP